MTDPDARPARGVLPACVLPVAGLDVAAPAEPGEVQALTPSRAATPAASTAPAPRALRPPRRDIDMHPMIPHHARSDPVPGSRSPEPGGGPAAAGRGPAAVPAGVRPRSGRGGAAALLQGLAVFGDYQVGQLLGRCLRAELVQGYPAALEQVHPVAHLEHLPVIVRDDDDRDVAL